MRYIMMAAVPALNYHRNGLSQHARPARPNMLQRGVRFSAGPSEQQDTASLPTHHRICTIQQPKLLERAEQVRAAHEFLTKLAQKQAPYPEDMKVQVSVPEEKWMNELEDRLGRLNRVVNSEGWSGKLKLAGFRALSGVEGKLHPVRFYRDEQEPKQIMHMHLNFSGVSAEDLVKFATFLKRFTWT